MKLIGDSNSGSRDVVFHAQWAEYVLCLPLKLPAGVVVLNF